MTFSPINDFAPKLMYFNNVKSNNLNQVECIDFNYAMHVYIHCCTVFECKCNA